MNSNVQNASQTKPKNSRLPHSPTLWKACEPGLTADLTVPPSDSPTFSQRAATRVGRDYASRIPPWLPVIRFRGMPFQPNSPQADVAMIKRLYVKRPRRGHSRDGTKRMCGIDISTPDQLTLSSMMLHEVIGIASLAALSYAAIPLLKVNKDNLAPLQFSTNGTFHITVFSDLHFGQCQPLSSSEREGCY